MNLKDTINKDIELLSKPKINAVVQAAKVEFDLYGIVNSKIKDIAKRAKVGEATIYRYFAGKLELVNLVAVDYWRFKVLEYQEFVSSRIDDSKTGLEQIEVIVDLFLNMYHNHTDILKFMDDYENYVLTHPTQSESKAEGFIVSLKYLNDIVIEQGYNDGSIPKSKTKEEIYDFMVLTFLPAVKTLALRKIRSNHSLKEDHNRLLNNMKESFLLWIQNKAS